MAQAEERRVVITGLGVVAPNGIGKEAFWHATSHGVSGIKPISRFPAANLPIRVAGEVSDFIVEDYIDRKLANRTDRMTHFVLAAVQEALQDAKLDLAQEDPQCVGAVIANTVREWIHGPLRRRREAEQYLFHNTEDYNRKSLGGKYA